MRNKILITGGAGYVGSSLAYNLIKYVKHNNLKLVIVDSGMFGINAIYKIKKEYNELEFHHCTLKTYLLKADLSTVQAIVHLSGLSNDPLADFDPKMNEEYNYVDTMILVNACVDFEVPRFIFASSASVYGVSDDHIVTEGFGVNPQSNYARSKLKAENYIVDIAKLKESFKPIILRKATIMGPSLRMRYDLVVNAMFLTAHTEKRILLQGGGECWRPLVSIKDVVKVYTEFLTMTDEKYMIVSNSPIYNVLHKNYRISELGLWIADKCFDGVKINPEYEKPKDVRSYRMSGVKLEMAIGCKCDIGVIETIQDLKFHYADYPPEQTDFNIRWIKLCKRVCDHMGIIYEFK